MARKFLDPNSIFQIEVNLISAFYHRSWHLNIQVEEGLDKVKVSIRNLKEFKTCFLVGTMPAPKLNPTLSLSGIQDSSALLLHRPGEACPLLGVPRAARVQTLWLLCWATPHDAWVLLHSSAGAECFRKKSLSSFQKFMKLEKVEIGGIRGKALTSNIGKVYEEFKVKPFLMKASIPLPKRQHFKNCNSNSTIHSPRKLLEPTSLNQRSIHTQSHL